MTEAKGSAKPQESQQSAREPAPAELAASFDRIVLRSLPGIAWSLAGLQAVFAVSHWQFMPKSVALATTVSAGLTALLLAGVGGLLWRKAVSASWAQPMVALIAGLILCDNLLHVRLLGEARQTTGITLLIIGTGCFLLSWRWWLLLVGAALGGWLILIPSATPSAEWTYFAYDLGTGTALSALVLGTRRAASARIERLRRKDERLQRELGQKLEELQRNFVEQARKERRLALQSSVSRVLVESGTLAEATPRLLEAIGETIGFKAGAIWNVDVAVNVLRCVDVWQAPDFRAADLEKTIRPMTFALGVGIPGRIWKSGKPCWIPDLDKDPNFSRAGVDGKAGLQACLGTPILLMNQCLGVLEFFGSEVQEPDRELLEVLGGIGNQIGQFIVRKEAEVALQERSRLSALEADTGVALTKDVLLEPMLQDCVQAVVKHLDAALVRIWTLKEADQMLELQASAGLYTHRDGPHGRVPMGQLKIGLIAHERKPHLTNQVVGDPRVGDQEWARREGLVAFAGYPLMIGDRLVGVLAMFARRPLTDFTLAGLGAVADHIAVGIERKREDGEIQRLNETLAQRARKVEQANRELTEFAYVVSHDLKAPLRGIGSLSSWLATDYGDKLDDAGREQLSLITIRVKRLNALIDGILAYSRAGRSREARMVVDLDAIARNVVEMLAPPPHICIEFETPLPTLVFEPTKAQQLFQNLLSNAIKYMDKPQGRVRVRCDERDGCWQFSVADNGPGIEAKYFDRIFQLFQTLAPRDEVEGTGVGLALVKKIVEHESGRVWVESTPGAGATICFTLPRQGECLRA